eukprot:COSAG01_NODE_2960_length_6792_cov_24.183573_3_plen_130_part_00
MTHLTLNNLFRELLNEQDYYDNNKANKLATNLRENDKELILSIDSSGYKKEDIKITYEDDILEIEANKNKKSSINDYIWQEFDERKNAKRQIKVGQIDFKKSKATYKNGIIEVILPKIKKAKKQELLLS